MNETNTIAKPPTLPIGSLCTVLAIVTVPV
jgi:hypothetical protein